MDPPIIIIQWESEEIPRQSKFRIMANDRNWPNQLILKGGKQSNFLSTVVNKIN